MRRRDTHTVPVIETLRVRNYRALRNLELRDLTPLTVLLGPNGSGKSTIFDVFAFLSECFTEGVRRAWDKRGRFKELRSRGAEGPIEIEVRYVEPGYTPTVYQLTIDEARRGPVIAVESLRWTRSKRGGNNFKFLEFKNGEGYVIAGEHPDKGDEPTRERLASAEVLAVNTLGQFRSHPRVVALRNFITGWYLSYLTTTSSGARNTPEAGPQERLSQTGDNLANVVQYLREQHPVQLEKILETLRRRIPRLDKVDARTLEDGRLLLQIKDAPFADPIQARFASDGTLKMLAYLTLLYDPEPPPLVGIEEPENFLHPRLLPELAEECRIASEKSQLFVTTHSPFFVDSVDAREVRVVYRDEEGYTETRRAADMTGIPEFLAEGAKLGHLWLAGHFDVGDPLVHEGGPSRPQPQRKEQRRRGA
ncbi:MAG TPA: AAA family ATPase [Candidatus Nanopelagicales bacterium]|nr:AAA family ATPase [Candidatus Nanopelagicales bacterium]